MIEVNQELAMKCLKTLVKIMKNEKFYLDLEQAYEQAIAETVTDKEFGYLVMDIKDNMSKLGDLSDLMNKELITALENHTAMNAKHNVARIKWQLVEKLQDRCGCERGTPDKYGVVTFWSQVKIETESIESVNDSSAKRHSMIHYHDD
jgi:hypothetical protein